MKTFAVAVLALFCFLSASFAQEASVSTEGSAASEKHSTSPAIGITCTEVALSDYVGGNGGLFHEGPVLQTWCTLTHVETGLYAGGWHSMPFSRSGFPDFGTEVDGLGGINKVLWGFALNGEAMWILTDPLPRSKGDVFQLSGGASRPFKVGKQALELYFTAQRVFPIHGNKPIRGVFLIQGVRHSVPLSERVSLNSFAELKHDNGAFGFQPGWIFRAGAAVDWKKKTKWSLQFPVVRVSGPLTVSDRDWQVVVGGGWSWSR